VIFFAVQQSELPELTNNDRKEEKTDWLIIELVLYLLCAILFQTPKNNQLFKGEQYYRMTQSFSSSLWNDSSDGIMSSSTPISSILSSLSSSLFTSPTGHDEERIHDRFLQEQEEEGASAVTDDTFIDGDELTTGSPLAIFSAVMSNLLLFFLVFGLSATVNLKDLQHQLSNKFAICTGVAMQFIAMPLLGFVSVLLFHNSAFTKPMGISLLVVTASPGGSYSNWWCSLFNAELALSVAMTSVSSILSIGLLPANLMLYGWLCYGVILGEEDVNIVASLDFGAIFISLGVVMGAILGGLFVGYRYDSPKFHERANRFGSICGIALILFSAFLGSGAGGAETNFWSLPWSFYVGTAFPCVIGMTLANVVSRSLRLSPPETVAISIECCYQNTAIATSVAVTMFSDPTHRAEAVSVPLFYGVVEAIIIGVYCLWAWKVGWTKAPADEKVRFCYCVFFGFLHQ
jgi:predicted Na+-dependent transporter